MHQLDTHPLSKSPQISPFKQKCVSPRDLSNTVYSIKTDLIVKDLYFQEPVPNF